MAYVTPAVSKYIEIISSKSLTNNFKFEFPPKIIHEFVKNPAIEWEMGLSNVVLDLNLDQRNNNITLNPLSNEGIFLESKNYVYPTDLQDVINIQLKKIPFSALVSFNTDLDILLSIYNLTFKYSSELSLIFDGLNPLSPCKQCKISELQYTKPTWLRNDNVIENILYINNEKLGSINIGRNTTEAEVVNAFISRTLELYVYLQIKYNAHDNTWVLHLDPSEIKLSIDSRDIFHGLTLRESFTPNVLTIKPNTIFKPFIITNNKSCYILTNSSILFNSDRKQNFKIIPLQLNDSKNLISYIDLDKPIYFQIDKKNFIKNFSLKICDINNEIVKLSSVGYSKICGTFHYRKKRKEI